MKLQTKLKTLTISVLLLIITTTSLFAEVIKSGDKSNLIHPPLVTDIQAWGNFTCGDLLEIYATKPKALKFVSCKRLDNDQPKIIATYKVSGEAAKSVEDFLVKNYDMGALKWACCGWQSTRFGSFQHPELTKIDPYLAASILMFASAEIVNKDNLSTIILQSDREKTEFTVTVELVII